MTKAEISGKLVHEDAGKTKWSQCSSLGSQKPDCSGAHMYDRQRCERHRTVRRINTKL